MLARLIVVLALAGLCNAAFDEYGATVLSDRDAYLESRLHAELKLHDKITEGRNLLKKMFSAKGGMKKDVVAVDDAVAPTTGPRVTLHDYFSNGTVLLRAPEKNEVFGWAQADVKKVTVTIGDQKKTDKPTEATDPNTGETIYVWSVKLKPIPGTAPDEFLTMTVQADSDADVITRTVYAGEVLLLTGQSNMMYPFPAMLGYATDLADLKAHNYYNMHIFQAASFVPYKANCAANEQKNLLPLVDTVNSFTWTAPGDALMETHVNKFGGAAIYIGRELSKYFGGNVHIGVYQNAVPGTRIQSWVRKSVIQTCDASDVPPASAPSSNPIPKNESCLFNGMISPLEGIKFSAIGYYQVEGNYYDPSKYGCQLKGLINSWRSFFGDSNLPFIYIQGAPYPGGPTQPAYTDTRDAQDAALGMKNVEMVRIGDLGDIGGPGFGLHPRVKALVGSRFALAFYKITEKADVETAGAVATRASMITTPTYYTIKVDFDKADGGVTLQNVPICGTAPVLTCDNTNLFQLQYPNGTYAWVPPYRINNVYSFVNSLYVEVSYTDASEDLPVRIKYPYSETPLRRIMSKAGLPADKFDVAIN